MGNAATVRGHSWLKVGTRVKVIVGHHAGERGIVTNSPGKVFNGWTVKLDSGLVVGAATRWLEADPNG